MQIHERRGIQEEAQVGKVPGDNEALSSSLPAQVLVQRLIIKVNLSA